MSVREQNKGKRLVGQTVVFSHDEFEGRVTRPGASQRGDAETERTLRAVLLLRVLGLVKVVFINIKNGTRHFFCGWKQKIFKNSEPVQNGLIEVFDCVRFVEPSL